MNANVDNENVVYVLFTVVTHAVAKRTRGGGGGGGLLLKHVVKK